MAQAGKEFIISWTALLAAGTTTKVSGAGKSAPIVALNGQEAYQTFLHDLREEHRQAVSPVNPQIHEVRLSEFSNP